MTKTYELSNERMIMADVDEEHHTATVSVYVLNDLVKEANKEDVLDKIREEIVEEQSNWREDADAEWHECRRILRIIDKYKEQTE